ncbi:hypothetical protein AGOR_G00117400 [Albula goreensis]|uniref:Uncharacterized protein n=1 Tax=Albula goreensis TaxID=1534307 RepID=A0A8T3DEH6_9TELE|nr:hypothetical protein AGOR_G00117400 [Albula goreensis]
MLLIYLAAKENIIQEGWIMRSYTLVALLCLGCGLGAASYKLFVHEWNKLILTHHWPQTFCTMESCHTEFGYWTLHGLWPDKGDMCNSSWHFNATLIEDLMPQMKKFWPDLLHSGPATSTVFWKHEWIKHGTCAVQSETLDTEHKYFSKALELYSKLDLDGTLKTHNIVPSETYYMLDDIEGVIQSFYKVKPKIQCYHPKKGEQILGQIEICFNKEYTLMDCQTSEEDTINHPNDILSFQPYANAGFIVCDRNIKVYYPPLKGKP